MSFRTLKKNASSTLAKLAEVAKNSGGKSYDDTRFWEPTLDKNGAGSAIIRFLPAKEGEDLPYVKTYRRSFKGPSGKWYVNNCLSTIGKDDPVGLHCKALWETGSEVNKEKARGMKRKLTYISNIYVISDPANPANDGKVFLFKYGVKIYEKIQDKFKPEFDDEKPINIFDMWTGCNFKLKVRNVEGFRNYDKSTFDSPSQLLDGDDAALEKVYNSLYSLNDFLDPKHFKSFADLEARFKSVIGDQAAIAQPTAEAHAEREEEAHDAPSVEAAPVTRGVSQPDDDDDADDQAFFSKLARG